MKLLRHDTSSSSDNFTSYGRSIKLIPTTSSTHPDFYIEGATLSKFIYEGRPTTTKPTFVALPYLTSYSTFHKCSRGTPCQPQASLPRHLTKPVVIILYSIHLEEKITLQSPFITRWNTTMESTQKKSIYSKSKNPMTFQVGIQSPASLPNRHKRYGIPSEENYISDH